jgi:hypothetical protein
MLQKIGIAAAGHFLEGYIAHDTDRGRMRTVRELVTEFRGLSGTAKQKAVLGETGLARDPLTALVNGNDLDRVPIAGLLAAMKANSRPVKPALLGAIGREHFTKRFEGFGCEMESFDYNADFSLVALGIGEEWLTSRLFIAAVMMERMRDVKVFVFVDRSPTTERRFVAVASVRHLRWALARRYPWLEGAWVKALESTTFSGVDPRTLPMTQSVIMSDTGALEPWQARQVLLRDIARWRATCNAADLKDVDASACDSPLPHLTLKLSQIVRRRRALIAQHAHDAQRCG